MAAIAVPTTIRAVGRVARARCGAIPSAAIGAVTMNSERPVPNIIWQVERIRTFLWSRANKGSPQKFVSAEPGGYAARSATALPERRRLVRPTALEEIARQSVTILIFAPGQQLSRAENGRRSRLGAADGTFSVRRSFHDLTPEFARAETKESRRAAPPRAKVAASAAPKIANFMEVPALASSVHRNPLTA